LVGTTGGISFVQVSAGWNCGCARDARYHAGAPGYEHAACREAFPFFFFFFFAFVAADASASCR
jgi:hypothetical protein